MNKGIPVEKTFPANMLQVILENESAAQTTQPSTSVEDLEEGEIVGESASLLQQRQFGSKPLDSMQTCCLS